MKKVLTVLTFVLIASIAYLNYGITAAANELEAGNKVLIEQFNAPGNQTTVRYNAVNLRSGVKTQEIREN